VRIRRFTDPVPRREIAMFWRSTSVYRDLLPKIADVIRREVAALGQAVL
jgi:LysR family hydrogen peroxide-inducible transcriptional activator